jgi:hypothetical protein
MASAQSRATSFAAAAPTSLPPPIWAAAAAAAAAAATPAGCGGGPPPLTPIDAPCTQCLRHGDPMHAQERLTAATPPHALRDDLQRGGRPLGDAAPALLRRREPLARLHRGLVAPVFGLAGHLQKADPGRGAPQYFVIRTDAT